MQRFDKPFLTKNLILLATILASGITFLIGSTVSIALPSIQAVFKSSLYELQWVLNSFALSLAVLILVGGTLGDKFGRKRVFSIGILLFTLATFASGLSRSIAQLVVFQVVAGVGAALMIPGSLGSSIPVSRSKRRARSLACGPGYRVVSPPWVHSSVVSSSRLSAGGRSSS